MDRVLNRVCLVRCLQTSYLHESRNPWYTSGRSLTGRAAGPTDGTVGVIGAVGVLRVVGAVGAVRVVGCPSSREGFECGVVRPSREREVEESRRVVPKARQVTGVTSMSSTPQSTISRVDSSGSVSYRLDLGIPGVLVLGWVVQVSGLSRRGSKGRQRNPGPDVVHEIFIDTLPVSTPYSEVPLSPYPSTTLSARVAPRGTETQRVLSLQSRPVHVTVCEH